MRKIDLIFELLEQHGPMSSDQLAEALGMSSKYTRAVISAFLARPDSCGLYASGSVRKGNWRTVIWSLGDPPECDQMSPTAREDRFISECRPLLRSLGQNIWRTVIVQVAA